MADGIRQTAPGHPVKWRLFDKEETQGIDKLLANLDLHETKRKSFAPFDYLTVRERTGGRDQGPCMFWFLECYKPMPKISQ